MGGAWLVVICSMQVVLMFAHSPPCQKHWFGPKCLFKCQCADTEDCETSEFCRDGMNCHHGMFGPYCQYVDLSVAARKKTYSQHPTYQVRSFDWSDPIIFSWARIHFKTASSKKTNLPNVAVHYMDWTYTGSTEIWRQCPDQQISWYNCSALDIFCSSNPQTKALKMNVTSEHGPMTVFVSGGRELVSEDTLSELDKSIDVTGSQSLPASTESSTDATLKCHFQFSTPKAVNRYVMRDVNRIMIDSYYGGAPVLHTYNRQKFSKFIPFRETVTKSPAVIVDEIFITRNVDFQALAMSASCAASIFGDSVCPHGKFGLECEDDCNCLPGESCSVSTGACLSGASKPFNCESACERGKFGSRCQYRCHCVDLDTCEETDNCKDGSDCAPGWFGPYCQFVDIALEATMKTYGKTTSSQHTVFRWASVIRFSWMRMHFLKAPGTKLNITLEYYHAGDETRACTDQHVSWINCLTVDIHCTNQPTVDLLSVGMTDVKSRMTEIYISGGRELVLEEKSKDYTDGNARDSPERVETEPVFPSSTRPIYDSWVKERCKLRLLTPKSLTRLILPPGITEANVTGLLHGKKIYHEVVTAQLIENKRLTRSVPISMDNVNEVWIDGLVRENGTLPEQCNAKLFGHSNCSGNMFGFECESYCSCLGGESCSVDTGACFYGNRAPPTRCMDGCPLGFHGIECDERCPPTCDDLGCKKVSGECLGCPPGFEGNLCDKVCETKFYGKDCSEICSPNCSNQECHPITGNCRDCPSGADDKFCHTTCKNKTFGIECSLPCPTGCNDEGCDIFTGECFQCKPGYQGPMCDSDCPPKYFGENCAQACSPNCLNKYCHSMSGQCFNCEAGRMGDDCDQVCNDGAYGHGCLMKCPEGCDDHRCSHQTGKCSGCKPGYLGLFCQKVDCATHPYGPNCSHQCPAECSEAGCDPMTGYCISCVPGFTGKNCEQACSPGYYGLDCKSVCSNGCEDVCLGSNGQCNTCRPGYRGPRCDTGCLPDYYGRNCSQHCPIFCEYGECDQITGDCARCFPGHSGVKCNLDCPVGFFGLDCLEQCPEQCKGRKCSPVMGFCLTCNPGYMGMFCLNACPSGQYGTDCALPCPSRCGVGGCDSVTGICRTCPGGYQGKLCDQVCPPMKYGAGCELVCSSSCHINVSAPSVCHHVTGECLYHAPPHHREATRERGVWVGVSCAVVMVILIVGVACYIRKRRAREPTLIGSAKEPGFENVVFQVQVGGEQGV